MTNKLKMTNEWLSLIANLGVLAGIIFLAIEIQQNTNIARATAYQQVSQEISTIRSMLLADAELDEVWGKYQDGSSLELNDRQARRVRTVLRSMFSAYENAYYFYTLGVMTDSEWNRFERGACRHIDNIGNDERLRSIPATDEFTDYLRICFNE